ncbi:protein obstructor-E-like [Stegodyphus dumicola]|uniref:protein obstructor-E-like n=1 Tax=Stegodyphus dumicola TaxID=202533 RepID=UPI0015A7CCDD|nr:protein obstructor-E-like [Stegodyphus dumicola]
MGVRVFLVVLGLLVVTVNSQRSTIQCKKENGLFMHDQYCDYYYECEDGIPKEKACPNGLAFSGKGRGLMQNCDYPHRVGCPDNEGRVMGQAPIGTDNCPWLYGVYAHQTSCTRYWQCWNGTATIQQCPFSLLYNDIIHSCDWPDNVPDCQKHPICKDQPNGHIPIDKSCGRFWLCVGGYPRLQRCPAGLAFSQTALRCELSQNVPGCEPPPTTAAPDDEDDSKIVGNQVQGVDAPPPRRPNARPSGQYRAQNGK